jgi:hypothetical protein
MGRVAREHCFPWLAFEARHCLPQAIGYQIEAFPALSASAVAVGPTIAAVPYHHAEDESVQRADIKLLDISLLA